MKKSATLHFSSKFINRNFRLKVSGMDAFGNKINKLVGVAGMLALIGVEMFNKLLDRATRCLEDVCVCKLRRGLKISFYSK
ncbi:MAG: ribosomal large subunit pseudouridine synthase B [Muribaculaceae bacterium]|nr:ribosomal large subunit pseudouridine synthase B [Muribaculaceae bacterium]